MRKNKAAHCVCSFGVCIFDDPADYYHGDGLWGRQRHHVSHRLHFSTKWFANVFSLKSFRRSFLTSLEVAFLATFIALLVGVPAAYALARSGLKGKQMLKSIFLSPTIVPGIVIGFILYQFLILNLRMPVFVSLLAGHFMVTLPYVIRVVGSSMEQFDFSVEEAAWSLGCPKGAAFFKVVPAQRDLGHLLRLYAGVYQFL